MIKLERLKLKNFFSHVDTEVSLKDYEGLVLIEGKSHDGHYSSNGSGKSTLLEGIVYALTGNTLRGVSVNDVVNRNYGKNTEVSLHFTKDDIPFVASRYRKHDVHGDSLVLYKGEENISKRVNKDTQKLLEDILGISYTVLVSTILLGEGLSSKFTQLSDPDKKSLIESTLNLNYDINKIRELANEKLRALKFDAAKLDGEISTFEEVSNVNVEDLEASILDNQKCILIYNETLKSLEEERDTLDSEIASTHPKVQLLNSSLEKINNYKKQHADISKEISHLQEEINHVKNSKTPVCTVCKQALQSAESLSSIIDNYQTRITENLRKLSIIEGELQNLPAEDVIRSRIDAIATECGEKSARFRDVISEYNSYSMKVAQTQKDIEFMRKTIADKEDSDLQLGFKKSKREDFQKSIDKYEYFYKLFSPTGIIVNILSEAVVYINERLATYSNVLLEKDYKINFVKGKISLVDSTGSSYQSLSNGEKRRLDIAIQFSLHDYIHMYCGNSVDTIFLDEVLDTLDDIGIENILTVLRMKLEYCKLSRIFVISHNSELKSYFDNVITVMKDAAGDSRVQI